MEPHMRIVCSKAPQPATVAAGKLGTRVGSELVTLCDSGSSEYALGAGGSIQVDDEGVTTGNTVIIDNLQPLYFSAVIIG
jgi:hypothetical protein